MSDVISTRKTSGQTQMEKTLISEREEMLCRPPKNQTSRGTFFTGGEFFPPALIEQIAFFPVLRPQRKLI